MTEATQTKDLSLRERLVAIQAEMQAEQADACDACMKIVESEEFNGILQQLQQLHQKTVPGGMFDNAFIIVANSIETLRRTLPQARAQLVAQEQAANMMMRAG
jgi:hypothetical protein